MTVIRTITTERIRQLRHQSHGSLYYFLRFLCGLRDMDESHVKLAHFYQQRHRRALVAAHRGFFKTSMGLGAVLWDSLEIVDYTTMVLSQREELAKEMLERIRFLISARPLLREVYSDRFPNSLDSWNNQRLIFNRQQPTAGPSIIVGSLRGRQESRHVHHLYCDDLEGADANTSDVPNEESEKFVRTRAEPLLISPAEHRISVVGTPHGPRPLVHKLKVDPAWAVHWTPLTDENSKPAFPARFTEAYCEEKRIAAKHSVAARQLYEEQLMLRPWVGGGGAFDLEVIRSFCYRRVGQYLIYDEIDVNLWKHDGDGVPEVLRTTKQIHMRELRFYIHFDPKHRDPDEMKGRTPPTTAAFIVVGISPDFHAFVVDTWIKDTGNLGAQLLACTRLYEKWCPFKLTWEAIGAQKWFKDQVVSNEKRGQRYVSHSNLDARKGRSLPRMSTRMQESRKQIQNKERQITEALDTWFSMGWLHLSERHTELWSHLETFPGTERPIDGVDCLAQGPELWKPPRSARERSVYEKRARLMEAMNPPFEHTGYTPLTGNLEQGAVN